MARKKTDDTEKAPRQRRKKPRRSMLGRFLTATAMWGFILFASFIGWHAISLPSIASLDSAAKRPPVVRVLARDGRLLARYGGDYGRPVRLADLPPHLSKAVLATEDRRFYDHFGVDFFGVARALLSNLKAGGIRQGGSTITQQLAKNLFLTQERTLGRKIRETLLAFWLERRLSKDQILAVYLNRVYLGAGVYGVDAAARAYFGVPAEKMTLYQSAVIAGLLKAPTRYNPSAHPARSADRANQVLRNMVAAGWLDAATAKREYRDKVEAVKRRSSSLNVRYFTDWIVARAEGLVGYPETDLVITTTLDSAIQESAETVTAETLRQAQKRKVHQAAFVAMTPDGAVRAMTGGADYGDSQFNRATQALRQPGSAFKLFVFLAGVEAGLRPTDRVYDLPVRVKGWKPRNYNREHRGAMTLREGAARSSNAVAVAVAEKVGRRKVLQAARRLGVTSPLGSDPSLALGAYEMNLIELVGAYAVMANGGHGVWPYGILEVRSGIGKLLYRRPREQKQQIVTPGHVAQVNDLLHAAVEWGTGRNAKLARPVAGKTGTSQGNRDAWFVGFTHDLVAGVWMGNDDAAAMAGVSGGSYPAAIWRRVMEAAHRGLPARALPGIAANLSDAGHSD
jgi:penicillin-binding protein 1A